MTTPDSQRYPCPVEGCQNLRRHSHVMCSYHWKKVPARLQREVYRLYRRSRGSAEHLDAMQRAITAAENQS